MKKVVKKTKKGAYRLKKVWDSTDTFLTVYIVILFGIAYLLMTIK